LSQNAYSGCSRDDIEFYLSKDFTPEQITEICKTSPASNSASGAEPLPVESPINDDQLLLKEAIDARNISITDEYISYTLKICVEYGEEDDYGFAPKACPDIRYTISLSGLNATESSKKLLFFGERGIDVKAVIRRKVMGGLDERTEGEKQVILKKRLFRILCQRKNTRSIRSQIECSIKPAFKEDGQLR